MKKIIIPLIICTILACAWFYSAGDPPARTELVTGSASYLKTNSYVHDTLSVLSVFPLPEEIPANTEVLEYRYAYSCGLLGDPNFSIKLVLRYSDKTAYNQEQQRIQGNLDQETVIDEREGSTDYYFGKTLSGLNKLTDEKVEDGNCVVLKFALLDDEANTVTYAVGQLFDGSVYDDDIIRVLQAEIAHAEQ